MSDRVAGGLLFLLAAWYFREAGEYQIDFGDPLGPSVFPRLLAVPIGVLALYMAVRPDPDPRWPLGRRLVSQGAALAALVGYALLLAPLGFLLATAILAGALAAFLGARPVQAVVAGPATSLGCYALFDWLLDIPLPTGSVFGG